MWSLACCSHCRIRSPLGSGCGWAICSDAQAKWRRPRSRAELLREAVRGFRRYGPRMSDRHLPGGDPRAVLRPAISRSASPQVLARGPRAVAACGRSGAVVVDLGCGRGDSVELFRAADPAPRADPFEPCRGHARRPYGRRCARASGGALAIVSRFVHRAVCADPRPSPADHPLTGAEQRTPGLRGGN
jgi:hypothetical protein